MGGLGSSKTPLSTALLLFSATIGKGTEAYVPRWYQSLGMEQRVDQLENNVTSLLSNQQQLLERVTKIFNKLEAMNTHREEGESSHGARGFHHKGGNHGSQNNGSNQSYALA